MVGHSSAPTWYDAGMDEKPQPAEKPKLRWYQYSPSSVLGLLLYAFVASLASFALILLPSTYLLPSSHRVALGGLSGIVLISLALRLRRSLVAFCAFCRRFVGSLVKRWEAKSERRWYQYHLWHLFLLMTVVAIPCSWLSCKIQKAKRQKEAVEAIEELGGWVFVDSKSRALVVTLEGSQIADAELAHLEDLTQVKNLHLNGTQITDAGLEHLKCMKELEFLEFNDSQITDTGLERLKVLRKLVILELNDTQVTDEGIEKLRQALPDCSISH